MVTRYVLNHDYSDLKKGELVLIYTGYTYGCIKKGNIAVERFPIRRIKPKNSSRFIEVSLELLDELVTEDVDEKKNLMTRVLSSLMLGIKKLKLNINLHIN